jgi:hypothetical protein
MRDESAEACDWFLFLNTKAHWTTHDTTTKPVASLNPRLPGLAERISSENAGIDKRRTKLEKSLFPVP